MIPSTAAAPTAPRPTPELRTAAPLVAAGAAGAAPAPDVVPDGPPGAAEVVVDDAEHAGTRLRCASYVDAFGSHVHAAVALAITLA